MTYVELYLIAIDCMSAGMTEEEFEEVVRSFL